LKSKPIQDVRLVADGLDHPECVIYHPDGFLLAGGEAGQIYRISLRGGVEEIANTGSFILGISLSPKKDWLAVCDLKKKCIWKLDLLSLQLTRFASGTEDHLFSIPNFVCFDKGENLYVSESGAFREINGKILKFSPEGKGTIWCDGPFNFANGMAIDKSGSFVYVVCTFSPSIERVQIKPDGSAGVREVFVSFDHVVPDGIAFDANGNLLVSCYSPNQILIVSPDRTIDVLVYDWEAHTLCNPTNIAFGGELFDELYIANLGRWHISSIRTEIKGLRLPCHA
jgi:sugar lactone lactonase YvrE